MTTIFMALMPPPAMGASQSDLRCGTYCLFAALRALDFPVRSIAELEAKLGQPSSQGYSMHQLAEAARASGAYALGVDTTLANLARRSGPFACIAALEERHYVCIYDASASDVLIVDPPDQRSMSRSAFETLWGGKALLLSNRPLAVLPARRLSGWVIPVALASVLAVTVAIFLRKRRGLVHP